MVAADGNVLGRDDEVVTSLANRLRTQAESVRASQGSADLADR